MDILVKNIKRMVKLGARGLGVFLSKEAEVLSWKEGDKVIIAAFKKGKKKGIIIEKR